MPSTATLTANAIIITTDDGQYKTIRAFDKLSCYGRVIEDISGDNSGEKIISIVHQSGEALISIGSNPALYPGNVIDGQTSFDLAKTSVFDAIGLSATGGGGGGGGGLTQSQTRDAVKDGLDLSDDVEAIKNKPILAIEWRVKETHGTYTTVGQELREFVSPIGSTWRIPGGTTDLATAPDRTKLERIGAVSASTDPSSRSNSDTIPFLAAQLNTAQFVAAAPAGSKIRLVYNNTDKDLYLRFGDNTVADPTVNSHDDKALAGETLTFIASQGMWFGSFKVMGDAPTTGFANIISQR